MARIFTPPDMEFDGSITRIYVRNCTWTTAEIQDAAEHLSERIYDIYLYHDSMNDIQWAEGIRTRSKIILDFKDYKMLSPQEFMDKIDGMVP